MNPPSHPPDPLLRSLTDEASHLPRLAAAEARRALTLRRQQTRWAAATLILTGLVSTGLVCLQRIPRDTPPASVAEQPALAPTSPPAPLIVRTEEQARHEPLPLPHGLNPDQESVLTAARGLPLLLVRDQTGKVTRIHVIER